MIGIEAKIFLAALDPEKLTSGGVILPDTSTEASDRGKVVRVGPGKSVVSNGQAGAIPMQTQIGDIVAYPKNLARKVEVDGEDFYVIRENELLMVIERGGFKITHQADGLDGYPIEEVAQNLQNNPNLVKGEKHNG